MERRKLPNGCVLMFCRKECIPEFTKSVNYLVDVIANLLFNNITPTQAPRFNSRGLMLYRSEYYQAQKYIQVGKLDAIWLAQFDKLEILSREHNVYIKMEDDGLDDVKVIVKVAYQSSPIRATRWAVSTELCASCSTSTYVSTCCIEWSSSSPPKLTSNHWSLARCDSSSRMA